jgi:hypothetical protein
MDWLMYMFGWAEATKVFDDDAEEEDIEVELGPVIKEVILSKD